MLKKWWQYIVFKIIDHHCHDRPNFFLGCNSGDYYVLSGHHLTSHSPLNFNYLRCTCILGVLQYFHSNRIEFWLVIALGIHDQLVLQQSFLNLVNLFENGVPQFKSSYKVWIKSFLKQPCWVTSEFKNSLVSILSCFKAGLPVPQVLHK